MDDSKVLIIVESPTKAKTISKFLPSTCTVVASKGHIRDLPEKHMAIDVENDFAIEYKVVEGKESLIRDLKKNLKGADRLLLATDEDREGESISWHLLEVLKPKIPYQRMVFHEITKSAIQKALSSGRDLDENLVQAQEGRRVIDRLYGYT
ncbi:MAG: toprim domain-containing protein, partial [Sphaerochaeta sp.]